MLLVVDQMRADYLSRFSSRLSGGLVRLEQEGMVFEEAYQDYANTETAPGHASLITGLPPSRHGIVGNQWYDRSSHETIYCIPPGEPLRYLDASTLGEWIKKESPASRVVAVSGKDRSAILMGGREADAVLWYDPEKGRFTTSDRLVRRARAAAEISGWLAGLDPVSKLSCAVWDRLDGPGDLPEAHPDDDACEPENGRLFPHRLPCLGGLLRSKGPGSLAEEVGETPYFDEMILDLAENAIDRFALGADDAPDLLAVGLSATDLIGHRYGPDSQEMLDQIRRLDRRVGLFLRRLEEKVGAGRSVVVLTSDHGIVSCPESDPRKLARRIFLKDFKQKLEAGMMQRLGPGRWIEAIEGNNIYLAGSPDDPRPARSLSVPYERIEREAAGQLSQDPAVVAVYPRSELGSLPSSRHSQVAPFSQPSRSSPSSSSSGADDPFLPLMRASWKAGRSGDLMIRIQEGWLLGELRTGTSHGTPYGYDTHVALIVRAPGLLPGRSSEHVSAFRVAPTIARLLAVPFPAGLPSGPLLLPPSR
ncbi:MAG: hypothetical protein DMF49_01095 [Acidobacteria bacterium]|nr:MAG: hypothetical protein DMF49_01095 [Acidobacteriota bacterium]